VLSSALSLGGLASVHKAPAPRKRGGRAEAGPFRNPDATGYKDICHAYEGVMYCMPENLPESLYAIDKLNFFTYIGRQFTKARLLKGKHAKSPV
jgi:hypothetical protein